jgi:pimeloyl-ACP methyl ester carboxylesterase
MEGAESIEGTKNVSSFRVYDDLFAWLADRSRFPALKRIVLAGHSGGGQVVQRYAILKPCRREYPRRRYRSSLRSRQSVVVSLFR